MQTLGIGLRFTLNCSLATPILSKKLKFSPWGKEDKPSSLLVKASIIMQFHSQFNLFGETEHIIQFSIRVEGGGDWGFDYR